MKTGRFTFTLFSCLLLFCYYQGLIAQTSYKLNVTQPPALVANAGADVTIDVGFNTIIGGTHTGSGGTGILTYQWSYDAYLNNAAIANPTAQPPGNLKFTVTVLDERGCTAVDDIFVTVIGGTSINEAETGSNLKIFPNPTSGVFTISLDQIKSSEIQIIIINLSGHTVYQDIFTNSGFAVTTNVDISNLSKGCYILRIVGESELVYRQIILK